MRSGIALQILRRGGGKGGGHSICGFDLEFDRSMDLPAANWSIDPNTPELYGTLINLWDIATYQNPEPQFRRPSMQMHQEEGSGLQACAGYLVR